jgi:hypothetical protein
MDNEILFFHNISNWRSMIKMINLYKLPNDNKPMTHITTRSYNHISITNGENVATKKITKFWTCTIQRLVNMQVARKRRSACQTLLIWSFPFLSLSLSLTQTQKRMLSHLMVNCAKMERLLGKLWIHSSWPITSHRKCPQCGVFWNLKLAKCCNNNPIPQFIACQTLRNQTRHQWTDGTMKLLKQQDKSKMPQFCTVYTEWLKKMESIFYVYISW